MNKVKLTLALLMLFISHFAASAQHYRGFFDASVDITLKNSNGYTFDGVILDATTSHGIQLGNCFVGAGAGVLYATDDYGVGIPIFAHFRYDFFNFKTVNAFVGLKAGYSIALPDNHIEMYDDGRNLYESSYWEEFEDYGRIRTSYLSSVEYKALFKGLYIQPSVGARVRLSSLVGLNFAISYTPMQMTTEKKSRLIVDRYLSESFDNSGIIYDSGYQTDSSKFWSHGLTLTVGVDF